MSNSEESTRRVVITGIGVVSPLGIGAEPFWEKLASGQSGIAPIIHKENHAGTPRNTGGEVAEFTEKLARKTYLKPLRKNLKVMCREIQLGVASALLALDHSEIDLDTIDHQRFGVDFGANLMLSPPSVLKDGSWNCLEEGDENRDFQFDLWGRGGSNPTGTSGMEKMQPLWLLRYLPNMPACHIGIAADARGPNNSITLDEASGNLALGEAFRVIQRGAADTMIAGTTGTRLHVIKSLHAAIWDSLADTDDPPETWSRPFDKNRSGQVLAEGACSFILEEETQARNREATIYGTILGGGSSCVADKDGNANPRLALVNSMQAALRDANLTPADIGHINAHGLSTIKADREEALAIYDVFGDLAASVPVTALKSYLGNSGSGCGTLELAGSLLGLSHGVVPATRNYTTPDSEYPLNVVHGEPLTVSNKTVLNINVTRAGQASALIVRGE
jgi:3-oxoacyl-[acyl-carrier-protein] synthase II